MKDMEKTSPSSRTVLLSYVAILTIILGISHIYINHRQPAPYMDELFHIRQAQQWCSSITTESQFAYDASITTPPGLYLPNVVLSFLLRTTAVCTTQILRLTPAIMTIMTFLLLSNILRLLRNRFGSYAEENSKENAELCYHHTIAFTLTLVPISFFYSHLYYTDTASTFCILLTWYFALIDNQILSSICGLLASMTRQTNIIWHFFIVLDTSLYPLLVQTKSMQSIFNLISAIINQYPTIIKTRTYPHVLSATLYVLFIVRNRGIAIGHRDHHTQMFHHVMLPYLSFLHFLFQAPFQLIRPSDLLHTLRQLITTRHVPTFTVATTAIVTSLILATSDYVHPFILSDNRHFTFYLYRWWLSRSTYHRMAPIPFYVYTPLAIYTELLSSTQSNAASPSPTLHLSPAHRRAELLLDSVYVLCACLVLLPSPLLEIRYFIIPSLVLSIRRLARVKPYSLPRVLLISLFFLIFNITLVYIFTEHPFQRPVDPHMPDDISPGRFMF